MIFYSPSINIALRGAQLSHEKRRGSFYDLVRPDATQLFFCGVVERLDPLGRSQQVRLVTFVGLGLAAPSAPAPLTDSQKLPDLGRRTTGGLDFAGGSLAHPACRGIRFGSL